MKNLNIILSFLIVALAFQMQAQNVPQKFKYQGVAKLNDQIIEGDIGLRISILQDSPDGEMVFQEQHNVQTNGDGVFSTEVGNGDTIHGSMGDINWGLGNYYMKVELDPDGGQNYVDLGWSQLVSVPFAMHAGTVDDRDDADADPENELQDLGYNLLTRELTITEGNTVILPSPGTDSQTLTLEGTILRIENGNSIDLAEVLIQLDNDPDPTNELQTLQWKINNTLWSDEWELQLVHEEMDTITGMPQIIVDDSLTMPDSDPVNECQILTIKEDPTNVWNSVLNILKKDCIEDSTIWVPFGPDIVIMDTDNNNEIQDLEYDPNGNQLTITGGNGVDLSGLKTPWTVTPSSDCVEYNGKATADSFQTPEGAVLIDDDGIQRFYPETGENTSNLCLENVGNTTWGKLETLNNGDLVGVFQSCVHRSGIVDILGPNGNFNVAIGHEFNFPNHGSVWVVDANNVERAGMFINNNGEGEIFAEVSNFVTNHPNDESKEIWYAGLDGPEPAAYERGTAQLENGEVFVPFSDHYKAIINPKNMTVMLTPLSANTLGLAVIEKSATGFKVKELMDGKGNFEFDWEVKSVRKNHENYQSVRERRHHNIQHTRVNKTK